MLEAESGVMYVSGTERAVPWSKQPRREKFGSPGNGVGEGNAEVEVVRAVVGRAT